MTIIIDMIDSLMAFIIDIISVMTRRIKTMVFSTMTCSITALYDDIQHFN